MRDAGRLSSVYVLTRLPVVYVNGCGVASPLDALVIVNQLNIAGPSKFDRGQSDVAHQPLDASSNGCLSALDALHAMNYVKGAASRADGEESADIALGTSLDSLWPEMAIGATSYTGTDALPKAFWSLGGTRYPRHCIRFRRATAKKESDRVPTGTRRYSCFIVTAR